MNKRRSELSVLSSYIKRIDSEVTMILQSLQWDRKHLIEGLPMAPCKYDPNHTAPPDRLDVHERECRLRSAGYSVDEQLLPEPVDVNADTLVTLNKIDIMNIIDYAAKIDPLFRKGRGPEECQPLTMERLQEAYSVDERRALHDAVVSTAPSCHDLLEVALPGGDGGGGGGAQPSSPRRARAAALASLRDMKRRRTKYRSAANTRNYSDALRDLIATQMEYFTEAQPAHSDTTRSKDLKTNNETADSKQYEEVHIKKEPDAAGVGRPYPGPHESSQRDKSRDKHKERVREKKHDGHKRDGRDRYTSSSKERSRDRSDYRSSEKYRKDDRDSRHSEYRDSSKSSRHSASRQKHERGDRYDSYERSHKDDRYTRYYDSKQDDFEFIKKRIKREKD